ncbi:PepSY domain-containing protein [Sphingomonas sp. SRS2]|uniref:PepSY domain-containing protein n=1 Tax=Sphingomonas sp. SRS2 TaxID=133190 RepID=UPI0006184091|nr:PepSY domain-containing protein [Sphingomonas sp. SRS2]KKC25664.1 hypothetical protein WP12_12720 [Sphingomonas sp. SRS2]
MSMRNALAALSLATILVASAPALAERNRVPEQDALRNGVRSGEFLPYQEMRSRAQGRVDGRMIGSEFDPGTGRYRFKFQRGGSVIWMDMDGRTGREIGRVGQ